MNNEQEKELINDTNKEINEENPVAENEQTDNTVTFEEQKAEETPITLEQELAEAKDKYLRLYSDFENYKRRTAKERMEFMMTANKEVLVSLIPVLDDFERALKAIEKANEVTAV